MNFMAGGGQGDDVLSQVDNMIEGRPGGGGGNQSHAGGGGITLIQTLADGVRDLLGGSAARRHRAENAAIRGVSTPVRAAASGVTRPNPLSDPTQTNPDGTPLSPSQQLLDGLSMNFGALPR